MIATGRAPIVKMSRRIPPAPVAAAGEGAAAKRTFSIPNGYNDFKDLLHRDDIDAVDVCAHNNKHAPITIAAFKAGKHVYCEKPIAGSLRDAEQMLQAAEKFDRKLHIQMGTLTQDQQLETIRNSGEIFIHNIPALPVTPAMCGFCLRRAIFIEKVVWAKSGHLPLRQPEGAEKPPFRRPSTCNALNNPSNSVS
jgi:hypothetical protein